LRPLLVGGDQERARRAGFENVPAIVGFGTACAHLTPERLQREAHDARRLTDRVLAAVADGRLSGVHVYGDPFDRVPHLVCLGIDGIEPQAVLLGLDQAGVAAHSGSACSSEALEPSPVLEAMGVDAHRSLRVSVGWNTTDDDIDALLDALPPILERLRALR
jgi:cysteine desulfurase